MLRLPHSTNARPIRVTQSSACQARPISKSPRHFIGCNKTPFLPYHLRDNGLRDTALAFTQHRGTSPNAKAHAARYHWPQAFTKLIMDMGSMPGVQGAGMVALERTSALSVRCGNDSIVLTPDQECLKGLGAARPTASGKLVPRNQTVIASWLAFNCYHGFLPPSLETSLQPCIATIPATRYTLRSTNYCVFLLSVDSMEERLITVSSPTC